MRGAWGRLVTVAEFHINGWEGRTDNHCQHTHIILCISCKGACPSPRVFFIFSFSQIAFDAIWDRICNNILMTHTHTKFQDFLDVENVSGRLIMVLCVCIFCVYRTHAIVFNVHKFCSCTDPLIQNSSYPDVTFFDEPQEKAFSSSGGHVDFDNGIEITVPPRAVPSGTTVSVKVQPNFAPTDVFVMPQGIHSASPSYLITGSDSKLDGDVTLTMEHHVNVSTNDDAKDLLFLQADTTPQTSDSASVYEYKEVPEARAEFLPGENSGKLTTRRFPFKFFKIGLRKRVKKWFTG